MKKTKEKAILIIIVALTFLMNIEIFAAEERAPLDATVFVKQIFEVSVTPLSIDFGEAESPSVAKDITISCMSNNNNPWEASISLTSPLSYGIYTIPSDNFHWEEISSSGSRPLHTGAGYIETTPHTFYSSGNDEYITSSPVEFTLRLYVDVPPNQPAGVYSTILQVKMRDTVTNEEVITPVDFSLQVKPNFTLSVTPSSLEFGRIMPGQTTESQNLYITCSTNNNKPWNVSIHALSEPTSGVYTIPNKNFLWQSLETGYGESMSITPFIFYRAKIGEYVTETPVRLNLSFKVAVPPTQPGGTYTTTLVLTMTEK